MSAHTPGKWSMWKAPDGACYIRSVQMEREELPVGMGRVTRFIAQFVSRNRSYEEADGRLISAAPELLESLDWLLASLDLAHPVDATKSRNPDDHERLILARAAAQSAIKKATGQ